MRGMTLLLLALGMLTSAANAQTVLVDEDFQGGYANNTAAPAFPGWTWTGGSAVKARNQSTADLPGPVGDEGIQFEWTTGYGTYDVNHNWAADDMYTLSFNASQQAWPGSGTNPVSRFIDVALLQDNGTILWQDQAVLPTQGNVAWNGPGAWGAGDWVDELLFSFAIDASTFALGTPGEEIDLRIQSSGFRGVYIDNVSLVLAEAAEVPEPASAAIWSLLGLALAGFGYQRYGRHRR